MISSYLKVEDDTLGLIDVAESFNSLTTAVNEKQEEIKTTSGLTLATLSASGLVSCGDLTVSGKTITTLVNEASGSGLTKSDIDDKQDKLTAGTNITINTATNTISATGDVTQDDLDNLITTGSSLSILSLNVKETHDPFSASNTPGQISCDSLLIGGENITSLSSSSSSSLSLHQFQGFPKKKQIQLL